MSQKVFEARVCNSTKWTFLRFLLSLHLLLCISEKSLGMFDFGAANSMLLIDLINDMLQILTLYFILSLLV